MESSKRSSILGIVIVLLLVAAVLFIDMRRRNAEQRLQAMSVQLGQSGSEQQNRSQAEQILEEIRRLYLLAENIEPTVAKIVDIDLLRDRNAFYSNAENGDYLVVTPTRAILYSSMRRLILDVVPIQLQQANGDTEN